MSILINLTEQQVKETKALATEIHKSKKWNWTWENILIGLIGEMGYSIWTNQSINREIYFNSGDGGIDFSDGAQIKTVTWSGPSKEIKVNFGSTSNPAIKKYVLAHTTLDYLQDVELIGEVSLENFKTKRDMKIYRNKPVWIVTEDKLDTLYNKSHVLIDTNS